MSLLRRAFTAVLIVFALVIGLITLCLLLMYGYVIVDNARFARSFFHGKLNIESVRASKRWFSAEVFGCTYAAVRFSESSLRALQEQGPAVFTPPGSGGDHFERAWRGAEWRWTPYTDADAAAWNYYDPFDCLDRLPGAETKAFRAALSRGDSFWFRTMDHGGLIAPEARLALIVRYGD